ncbi:hypothetical protein FQN50_005434 [Emmonsiellopsis sp. PD_5]|nr:hypothetical protein FQN50_005434 [Emmonsiellopsis sp. PD_5]
MAFPATGQIDSHQSGGEAYGESSVTGETDESEMEEDDDNQSECDEHDSYDWLEDIDCTAECTSNDSNHHDLIQAGYCHAQLIRRSQIGAVFYDEMEQISRQTYLLSIEIFDRYGRLKPEFKEHPLKRGTGAWGQELDKGDILLIDTIDIMEPYRRLGLATRLINDIVAEVQIKTNRPFFAIAWPSALYTYQGSYRTEKEFSDAFDMEQKRAIAFFRSLFFRRIGGTVWFAFASDPRHPSRSLAIDYDPPQPPSHPVGDMDIGRLLQESQELDDKEIVNNLAQLLLTHPADDPFWLSRDKKGNTVLHNLAIHYKPKALRRILEHEFGMQLKDLRNDGGDTPLEALLLQLENDRINTSYTSDFFQGFKKEAVQCVALLKGIANSATQFAQITYGCTCGECEAGFLSPRMAEALLTQAELAYDRLSGTYALGGEEDWKIFSKDYLGFVAVSVRQILRTNKSMRQGFADLFRPCCDLSDTEKVANEWKRTKNSFEC